MIGGSAEHDEEGPAGGMPWACSQECLMVSGLGVEEQEFEKESIGETLETYR